MALPTASWLTDNTIPGGGGSDQGFQNFMYQLSQQGAQDMWNQGNQQGLDQNQFLQDQTAKNFQEIGEGNQGKTLFGMYQQGLTPEQVQKAQAAGDPNNQTGYQNLSGIAQYLNDNRQTGVPDEYKTFLDQGFLTQDKSGNYTVNQAKVPAPATVGLVGQPLFSHSAQAGGNTGAFGFDPQRGFVTSPENFSNGGTLGKIGSMLPQVAAAAAAAATFNPELLSPLMAGGMAEMTGGLGSSLFNFAGNEMLGNKPNPMGLASGALGAFGGQLGIPSLGDITGSLGIPSQVTQFMPQILQAAMGRGINPVQFLMTLARSAGKGS